MCVRAPLGHVLRSGQIDSNLHENLGDSKGELDPSKAESKGATGKQGKEEKILKA